MTRGFIIVIFATLMFGCKKPADCCMPYFFQKVILNYSAGFTLPQDYIVYSIEISSGGYARLHVEQAYSETGDPDHAAIGYFEGQLEDTSLARLNDYFAVVNIDDLESEPNDPFIIIADAPYYNFIIYQQDERKSLVYQTALQDELKPVNDYLYFLARNNHLPKTTTHFEIEHE